jgi:hypothetical protein
MKNPICELDVVENLSQECCKQNDPIFFYGSFAIFGHQKSRDVDVIRISSVSDEACRLRCPSVCNKEQPINLYVVPKKCLLEDLKFFKFGGWWVTKPILGFTSGRDFTFCSKFYIDAIISYTTRCQINLEDDTSSAMSRIALSLCVRYPTFIKSVAKLYQSPTWLQTFRNQFELARPYRPRGKIVASKEYDINLNDDRISHYWEMLRLRPLKVGNDVVPAAVKLDQAKEFFIDNIKVFDRLFSSNGVTQIETAIDEVRNILKKLEASLKHHANRKI